MLYYRAHQVQDHERGDRGVQVDADGIHAGRVEAEHGARFAGSAAFFAGFDDQVLVQQAAGDVGDGLRRKADNLGELHAAQSAG